MNFKSLLVNLIFMCCVFSASKSMEDKSAKESLAITDQENNAVLGDRPSKIQAAVDAAFEQNKEAGRKSWRNNGDSTYELLGIDDDVMLEYLASKNQEKDDIYIIDVGCARGGWGQHAQEVLLQSEACRASGKKFHIFSVTGGKECKEMIEQTDNVTLYQLNYFKIENMDEEFLIRGFDLIGKVDLIVSNWTLRHLVDPFGTLKRMYSLLTPLQGMLLSNGFLFMLNDSEEVQVFPDGRYNISIFTKSNSIQLFRAYSYMYDAGQFLLMRDNNKELAIPLEYDGDVHGTNARSCASKQVTVFKNGSCIKQDFYQGYIEDSLQLYCDMHDQRSKNLYEHLKAHKLFL